MLKENIYRDLDITEDTIESWQNTRYLADVVTCSKVYNYVSDAETIIIFGDYDCDGICASFITEESIHTLFPDKEVITLLPERSEGYGINPRMIEQAVTSAETKKTLVITVDTGITAKDYIDVLRSAGVTVIVTDHHEFKKENELPNANLVIDPNCQFIPNPFVGRNYCGAAVAFKLFEQFLPPQKRTELMCYAGVASVADCIIMRAGTWQLVRRTLDVFNEHREPKALSQLLDLMVGENAYVREDTFGFYLGPALNAPGRMYSPLISLEYLRQPTMEKATELVEINQERKTTRDEEYKIVREAILLEGKERDNPIWIYVEHLHTGIVGILAGLAAEEFCTSAIVLTDSPTGVLTGSARSFGDFNMYEYLRGFEDRLLSFGGHPGAAGLKLTMDSYLALQDRVERSEEAPHPIIGYRLEPQEIPEATEIVDALRPYGENFNEPIFHTELDLAHDPFAVNYMGPQAEHLRVEPLDRRFKIVHFFHTKQVKEKNFTKEDEEKFYVIGKVHQSYYRGKGTPEMGVDKILTVNDAEAIEQSEAGHTIE